MQKQTKDQKLRDKIKQVQLISITKMSVQSAINIDLTCKLEQVHSADARSCAAMALSGDRQDLQEKGHNEEEPKNEEALHAEIDDQQQIEGAAQPEGDGVAPLGNNQESGLMGPGNSDRPQVPRGVIQKQRCTRRVN